MTKSMMSISSRLAIGLMLSCGAIGGAMAAQVGPLVAVSKGPSPFAGCTADDVVLQEAVCTALGAPCVNYLNTEIEPYVAVNPTNLQNLLAGWQQDRWSNGGSRGLVSGYSKDGGRSWKKVLVPGTTLCSGGGLFIRASDPWVSFAPSGTSYFFTLAFQPDRSDGGFGANAMLVNRSTDGGASWGPPTTLIFDNNGQILNDKNSLTADPTNPSFAYAVWDRLRDFTLPESSSAAAAAVAAAPASMDGVALARKRVQRLKAEAQSKGTVDTPPEALAPEATVFFKGPAYLARTTDGGTSWETAKNIYDPGPNAQTINNLVEVPPSGTVFDFFTHIFSNGLVRLDYLRSFDKGANFAKPPKFVDVILSAGTLTPDLQEPVRDASILFDTAVDRTTGALYAVWQDVRFRGVEEIAFSQSTDGGLTWSNAVRINQTPFNSNPLRKQAFIPSVAVTAAGELVVTYYDFRNDDGTGELTDYWAVSCTAGCAARASWGSEKRLTKRSFDMLNAPVAGGHFLGDYMGLAISGNVAHPLFAIATGPNLTTEFTRRIRY